MQAEELFTIPNLCPACGGPTEEDGDFLYCRSKSCPARLSGSVKIWIRQLGLLHWGDALIDALTSPDNPRISTLADIYRLDVEQLAECCSGLKVAEKLHHVLHSAKTVTLELMLSGLNIQNLGISTATDIVQSGYDSVDKILNLTYEDLLKVQNVGEITARQVAYGLQEKSPLIRDLASVLVIQKPKTGPLDGKSFCITGELSKNRKAVEKLILNCGGSVKSSVTATTTYLVTNFPDTGSSKMKAAKKHGVSVIDETQLMAMLNV